MSKQKINGEELVKLTIIALEDVKAQDIQVIDVREKHSLTDYMIIATGTSNRQINAMLEKVRETVKKEGAQPLGEEGKGDSLSLIHISEPTRRLRGSRMPSSA